MNKTISFTENIEPSNIPSFLCAGLLDLVKKYPEYLLLKNETGIILDFGKILKQKLLCSDNSLSIIRNIYFMNMISIFNESYGGLEETTRTKSLINYRDSLSKPKTYTHIFIDYQENLLGVSIFGFQQMWKVKLNILSSVKEIPKIKHSYKGTQLGTPLLDSVLEKAKKTNYKFLIIEPYTRESLVFYERYLSLKNIFFEPANLSYDYKIIASLEYTI